MSVGERAKHWADYAERGDAWGPNLLAFIYRRIGRTACLIVMAPVILYFYAFGARQRRASLDYLRRVRRARGESGQPGYWDGLRHFFSFGKSLVDKFGAWLGHLRRSDIDGIESDALARARRDPRGAIIISAHVGNPEIIRAVATREQRRRVQVVVHTKHARHFNAMLERFAPRVRCA